MAHDENVYCGISGLSLPVPRYLYPPAYQDKSRLCYYASLFNSIEINSTFYKLPMASTVSKWAADVPDGFRFTFKLWREITHNKQLIFDSIAVDKFFETVAGAGAKKGCILVQFPPGLKAEYKLQLEKLIYSIHQANDSEGWRIAVEFRNKSWYRSDVFEMLEENGIGLVIHDIPASASPLISQSTDFVYIRFHGPEPRYRGSYRDDFLYEYSQYINEWKAGGKTVYCYFNNTMGNAVENLQTLNRILSLTA